MNIHTQIFHTYIVHCTLAQVKSVTSITGLELTKPLVHFHKFLVPSD